MVNQEYTDPITNALRRTFESEIGKQIEEHYFSHIGDVKKWFCFSDYSIDSVKPNKVISFSFLPHLINLEELAAEIKRLQGRDIKNTRTINPEFINFLRSFPFINFSFIINNDRYLMTSNLSDLKVVLTNTINALSKKLSNFSERNEKRREYYSGVKVKLNKLLALIQQNKKIYLTKDMVLIAAVGSFVAAFIANYTKAEVMGWFPDRDATNDLADNIVTDIFNISLISKVSHSLEFAYSQSLSSSDEFFADLTRIPDYITGTLADYNFSNTSVSKDKFNSMLEGFFTDNNLNNFVFSLDFHANGTVSCDRVGFKFKE